MSQVFARVRIQTLEIMPINRFEEFAKDNESKSKLVTQVSQKRLEFVKKISLDSDGTSIDALFSNDDAKLAGEFIAFIKKKHFPSAEKLKLEVLKPKKLMDEDLLKSRLSRSRKQSLSPWVTLWRGKGYQIGRLGILDLIEEHTYGRNSTYLYLCDDGRLRCSRTPPIFNQGESYTAGYGSLPIDKSNSIRITPILGRFSSVNFENEFILMSLKEVLESIVLSL